jgi:pimeloyl-ACP methyl ester carboxylesterase
VFTLLISLFIDIFVSSNTHLNITPMQSFIDFQEGKIHFMDEGHGPVLVLLHGFLEQKSMWKSFAEKLSKQFRVIAPDLPGHGASSIFEEHPSIDFMADAVEALMEFLRIPKLVIIGHSMGAYVAQNYAARYPARVQGFGYFHSHAAADNPGAKINRGRAIKVVEDNHVGFISNFIPDLFTPENRERYRDEIKVMQAEAAQMKKEGIVGALTAMRERSDGFHLIQNTSVPVLFIVGQRDSRAPMEELKKQFFMPEKAHVLLLKNSAHMGFLEEEEDSCLFVAGFVRSCYKMM